MFQLSPHLWTPQRRGVEETMDLLRQGKSVCLYSPTGGGKTSQAIELLRWAESNGCGGIFYVNRRLLIQQTLDRITKAGLQCGVRAAEYPDLFDFSAPFQVASADTERARVITGSKWQFHDIGQGGVVVVDECFVKGTVVSGKPIETIKVGDIVECFNHESRQVVSRPVLAISAKPVSSLVVIKFRSGKSFCCTPSHPVWVEDLGEYVSASELKFGWMVLNGKSKSSSKNVRNLRKRFHVTQEQCEAALQFGVRQGLTTSNAIRQSISQGGSLESHERFQSNAIGICEAKHEGNFEINRAQAFSVGWEWQGADSPGVCNGQCNGNADGRCCSNSRTKARRQLPELLQDRCRLSSVESSYRDRRPFARLPRAKATGRQEDAVLGVDWVDSVKVHEQASGRRFDELCPDGLVYNLEVEEHANYFANGVLVHNCHIQRTETMRLILDNYKRAGARIVLLTATPIGLSDWADEIVISGRLQEYRDCQALVPAVVKSIEQPDLSKVKRNATGEFVLDGKKSKIYTQTIVGNVIDRWKKYNPDARPTMLFAPGKPESVWFTEQFHKLGVSWAHVDATDAVVDGQRYKLSRALWEDILAGYRDNRIKGLSCRFKLREGIDVPATYHCILATPIGSLASYIQTVGRVLRYSAETPDHVIVTDHGGNYLRHGSPNHDRDWRSWWTLPEHAISNWHLEQIRDGKTPEPIRCPQCEGERAKGITCPHCGYTHQKSQRMVVMEDGRMVTRDGRLVKPKYVKMQPDTQRLWDKMYFAWKRKKVDRSFNQLEGFFAHEHGYHPPRTLANMPTKTEDWYRKVHTVPVNDLTPKGGAA